MSSPDDILSRIDGVVEAWERGPDAMRWTGRAPDPVDDDACQSDFRGATSDRTVIYETHAWTAPGSLYRETFERFIATANGLDAAAGRPFQRHYLNDRATARFVPSLEDVDAPTRADLDGGMEVGIVNDGLRFAMGGEVPGSGYPRIDGGILSRGRTASITLYADASGFTEDLARALGMLAAYPQTRRHRRACRICNPQGNPLGAFSGNYDYRQRRKSQARRRRR